MTFTDPRKVQATRSEAKQVEGERRIMTKEMDQNNPAVSLVLGCSILCQTKADRLFLWSMQVDYTLPGQCCIASCHFLSLIVLLTELVTFIFSDVGSLRPSGVGDALLAVYGGNAD